MLQADALISFDETYRVRVLDPDVYDDSVRLKVRLSAKEEWDGQRRERERENVHYSFRFASVRLPSFYRSFKLMASFLSCLCSVCVSLQEESSTYCERVSQIINAGDETVSKIEKQAKNIEAIKLAAIGQRNKLSATKEAQAKEDREMKQKVLEKQEELER